MDENYLDEKEINLMVSCDSRFQKEIMEEHNLSEKWVSRIPARPMKMIDRAWYNFEKGAGKYGRGYLRAEKDIDQNDWFFYAHFWGDPVMPGALGIDGCYQCLGVAMIIKKIPGIARALGGGFEYAGQVLTGVRKISYRMDVKHFFNKPSSFILGDVDFFKDDDKDPIYKLRDAKLGFFKEGELERSSSYRPNWDAIKENALKEIEASRQFYLGCFGKEGC